MKYPETRRQTPNVTKGRTNERKGVVFHHTGGSYAGAVAWLTDPAAKAAAHVVIARDGKRCVLAGDEAVTWHAGVSAFRGRKGCNGFMLGVEFELLRAEDALTDAQIESALEWLDPRWKKYGWTVEWMTDHRQVSPGRKIDLSPANWDRLETAILNRFH